ITAFLSPERTGEFWGPYYEIKNWPKASLPPKSGNTYTYEDKDVIVGFKYWYYVAAYDDEKTVDAVRYPDGLESFYTMNANGTDGTWQGLLPLQAPIASQFGLTQIKGSAVVPAPAIPAASDIAAETVKIEVVPNPYEEQALWDAGAAHTIQFRNIPVPCTIRIYNLNGVFINTIDVKKTTTQLAAGGRVDWDLRNTSNVEIASGLYIYVVESPDLEESVTGTFVVFR
ncbi:MAG: hypothetical protein HY709_08335, partial [Candidatus Latescibacteria bacterium]|nr:hypothetical protein [Candidatus Latescibacterota bacterium]